MNHLFKFSGYILFFLWNVCTISYAQTGFGEATKINQDWYFKLDDIKEGKDLKKMDRSFRKIDLPHDWSAKETLNPSLASATGFLPGGIGWYYKTIAIPKEDEGKKIYLFYV